MQFQAVSTIDMIGAQPLVAGAIGAGDHQPVQHAGEHCAFDRKAEAASGSEFSMTLRQPVCSHRRPKIIGAPMRTLVLASSVPACRLESSMAVSENRAPERSKASSLPLASKSSTRPRVASTRWTVRAPSREFSTICK